MSRKTLILVIISAGVIGALAASYFASEWLNPDQEEHQHTQNHSGSTEGDFHLWLHENLELTLDQEAVLAPLEKKFASNSAAIQKALKEASQELAEAVVSEKKGAARVEAAVAELNHQQGVLQKLTLDHFYEMKTALKPEQAKQLRQWIHDSIVNKHIH